ncbi:MAG: hypothetical protein WC205_01470 [Opitutaceae bacterium]|jgi:hypothetical protein
MKPSARLFLFPLALVFTAAIPAFAQTGPELLAKYNFENIPAYVPDWGAGHGSTYKPATGWKTPFKVSLDSGNPHAGANALRFDLLESSEKEKLVHGPAIKIAAPADGAIGERKLLVRLFVRASGVTGKGVGIRVLERDEKNASIRLLENKNSLIPVSNSADWVELQAEGVLHSRTRSVTFMVVAYQSEVPATVWIDDVSVELVPASGR